MKTITTFSDGIAANIAKSRLEAAGIRVYLADEQTSAVAWHLTNAIGGIKLQVADERVDEARAVLADEGGDAPALDYTSAISETATDDNDNAEPGVIEEQSELDERGTADESETIPTLREKTADRALRGALFAIFVFPVELYVFWLLIKVFLSDERLDAPHRRNAIVAAVVNLPLVMIILAFAWSWIFG